MEISLAKEKLQELIDNYNEKLSALGAKTLANVYFVDPKSFLECKEEDNKAGAVCASITILSSDATDESGMCGFDIVLEIKKKKQIDDKEFENAVCEFSEIADEFIKKFEEASDKDQFIKEESEREKSESAEKLKELEGEMQKLTAAIIIGGCGIALIIVISIIVGVIFG